MVQCENFIVEKAVPFRKKNGCYLVISGIPEPFIKQFNTEETGFLCCCVMVFDILNEGCIETIEFVGFSVNIFVCVDGFSIQNGLNILFFQGKRKRLNGIQKCVKRRH